MTATEKPKGKFKVVTANGDRPSTTANNGFWPKGHAWPSGLTREDADNWCAQFNARNEKVGLITRYKVVPL